VTLTSAAGQSVVGNYGAPAATGGTPPIAINCSPTSGSVFPLGSTTVSCTATDAQHNTARCTVVITVAASPRLSVTNLLAFGDSITAGEISNGIAVTPIDPSEAYPAVLARLLKQRYPGQSMTVVNDGKSGETAAQGADRLPRDQAAYHPDLLLLLEGINDLHGSVGPAGIPPAIAALNTMMVDARSRGVRVIVGTLLPANPGALLPGTVALIAPFNAQLVPVAAADGAVIVDLYSAFLADMTDWIGPDGLHPTPAGYQELAQLFFGAVVKNFEVPSASAPPRRAAASERAGPDLLRAGTRPGDGSTPSAYRPCPASWIETCPVTPRFPHKNE
jgi:lysophospholipase L1-like esterase